MKVASTLEGLIKVPHNLSYEYENVYGASATERPLGNISEEKGIFYRFQVSMRDVT